MILRDLLQLALPWRSPIQTSGRVYAHDVLTRLDVSARHLSTVELGRQLEPWWQDEDRSGNPTLPSDHGTVITAAQTLVFAGAQACLDLCASAIVHWHGIPAANRDFDLGDLDTNRLRPHGVVLELWAKDWRDRTTGDHRFKVLDRYRSAQIHRIVRRSTTVRLGESPPSESWLSPSPSIEPSDPLTDTYATVSELTKTAWIDCWSGLSASAAAHD